MMKIRRKITVEARDKKAGMTVQELKLALQDIPDGIAPVVKVKLSGKIYAISFEISAELDG
jgi:hypothetical protein